MLPSAVTAGGPDDSDVGAPRATVTAMEQLGTILSIWAHPDDETYLAGGLMAAAAANGQRVVCVSATAGEAGTDDPTVWPPPRLGAVRRLEAAAAMAVLGVAEHRVLGLPDGGLSGVNGEGLVGALLDEVRPDTVLTFGPDGITFHSDHVAVHQWVVAAWAARGRPCRLLQAVWTQSQLAATADRDGIFMTEQRPLPGSPDLRLVLDGPDLDRKVAALRAMATQTGSTFDTLGWDGFAALVAEEAFVDALRRVVPLHGS